MKITPVKGTADYLPSEVLVRDYLQSTILETYRSSGFERITTPIIEDIENIMYTVGIDALPENLQEIALLRLANPEESLATLAKLSGLSRSGVNHRLKKITEIARELE